MRRRIFAFVTMVVTLVLSILLLVQPIQNMVNLSNDYGQGITLVYDITKRSDVDTGDDTQNAKDLTDIDIDGMVMSRLNAAGVRGAEVTLLNPDDPNYSANFPQFDSQTNIDGDTYQRLRVTLTQTSSSELENIKFLIQSTGELTITDAENHAHTGTDFFESDKPAEVKYDEGIPYVLLYVQDESTWNDFKAEAEAVKDSSLQKQLFIWRNFVSGVDTYEKAFPSDSDVAPDTQVKDKILFRDSTDSAFSSDDVAIKLTTYKDANNTSHDWTISSAKAYVAAINAEDYGFDINLAYSNTSVSASLGENALLFTTIGFAVAYVVLFIVMICIYGWGGVVSLISNTTSLALNVLIFSLLGFELSPAAVIGLAISVLLGVLVNTNYFQRVRDEISKGRDLVKANKEGYHKSYLLTVDLCAVTFLAAISIFFMAKDMTQVATGVVTIGSILTFLITNYFTKWMLYWLSTGSAASGKGKNNFFGLRGHNKEVPLYTVDNVEALPKRSEPAPTKKEKKRTITGTVVFATMALLGAVGLGVMGGLKGGEEMFSLSGSYKTQYRIEITTTATGYRFGNSSSSVDFTTDTGANIVKYLHSEEAFGSIATTYLDQQGISYTAENKIDTYLETVGFVFSEDNGEFVVVDDLQNDTQVVADDDKHFSVVYASFILEKNPNTDALTHLNTALQYLTSTSNMYSQAQSNMADAKDFKNETLANRYAQGYRLTAGLAKSSAVSYYETWFFSALALGIVVIATYVFLRFGLCAFITTLCSNVAVTTFALGFISVCQIAFSPFTAFGVAMASLVIGIFSVLFFEKNAEMLRSLKIKRTNDVDTRFTVAELSVKASFQTSGSVLCSVLAFTTFGCALFGVECIPMMVTFGLMGLVGIALCYLFNPYIYLYLRTHIHFAGAQSKADERKAARANKPKRVIEADPDETKETIIPGLNDYQTL